MTQQSMVPEITTDEYASWFASPDCLLACPVRGCGLVGAAYWDGMNETLHWPGCGHVAFFPEEGPVPWPPSGSHIREDRG